MVACDDKLIIEENKALVERYPFLLPRNVFTDKVPEDYDYTYTKAVEVPCGWTQLFLQMCEDIRQPLIDADYLDKFRFTQIKEKYNTLRCYHFGAPKAVCDIIEKYEQMARYVCSRCGKPAIYETRGYFLSFCDNCFKDFVRHEEVDVIKFKDCYEVTQYSDNNTTTLTISFKDEWERYLERIYNNGL